MAASLATTDRRRLALALDQLTPGSVAYRLVVDALDYDPDEDGSDAYVRHLELAGYDEARFQEDMEARMGIPV